MIGGAGLVGTELVRRLTKEAANIVSWTTRETLDLSKPIDFEIPPSTEIVFLVAAIAGFEACEANPASWTVNADAPIALAQQAESIGAFPIFVSSDAVESVGLYTSAYARQKTYAEMGVLMVKGAVVRPTKIMPDRLEEFCKFMVRIATYEVSGVHRWR